MRLSISCGYAVSAQPSETGVPDMPRMYGPCVTGGIRGLRLLRRLDLEQRDVRHESSASQASHGHGSARRSATTTSPRQAASTRTSWPTRPRSTTHRYRDEPLLEVEKRLDSKLDACERARRNRAPRTISD